MMMHRMRMLALGAGLLLANACGSGTGDSDGSLSQSVGETRARYQVLELATGVVTAVGTVPDLLSAPAYRTTHLVFRLVETGSGTLGSSASALGAAIDPAASSMTVAPFYLAVFETTQAQWQALGGGTPWTQVSSVSGGDDVRTGDMLPAVAISHDLAGSTLTAYQGARGVRLGLPSDAQWETACRAGTAATWPWGEDSSPATVAAAAVVWETAGATRGARGVGQLAASSLGFFDFAGNVWELSAEGHLRGGSWNDPLSNARAAHRASIDPETRHLLVGARLSYQP